MAAGRLAEPSPERANGSSSTTVPTKISGEEEPWQQSDGMQDRRRQPRSEHSPTVLGLGRHPGRRAPAMPESTDHGQLHLRDGQRPEDRRAFRSTSLAALTSLFVPRSRKLWVYGSGIGLGEGALPLYDARVSACPSSGMSGWRGPRPSSGCPLPRHDVVRKNGVRGWWTTARAKVIVVTHGFGDANRYAVRGAFIVQLWHGLPFKHLHLDSRPRTGGVPARRGVVRRFLGWLPPGRPCDLAVPGRLRTGEAEHRQRVRRKPENVVVLGDVRDDVLLVPDDEYPRATRTRLTSSCPGLPTRRTSSSSRRRGGTAPPTPPSRPTRSGTRSAAGSTRTTPCFWSATIRSGAAISAPARPIRTGSSDRPGPGHRPQPAPAGRRRRGHRLLLARLRLRARRSARRALHARPHRLHDPPRLLPPGG